MQMTTIYSIVRILAASPIYISAHAALRAAHQPRTHPSRQNSRRPTNENSPGARRGATQSNFFDTDS